MREQSRLHGKGTPGVGKSEVSRLWVEEGGKVFGMFWEGTPRSREALSELERFVSGCNAAARESLREVGDDMIGLHGLNVPATLNASLLSTNLMENPFRNVRRKTDCVCRWRKGSEQASRWLAHALLEAERGFRRLRNHKDLAILRKALRRQRE